MKANDQETKHDHEGGNAMSILAGFIAGGIAGAAAALLFAPQSGSETRAQIQQKSLELRDRASETVEGALSQVRSKTNQIGADVRGKAEEVKSQGQEILVQQLDRVSAAAEAGKAAIQSHPSPTEKANIGNS